MQKRQPPSTEPPADKPGLLEGVAESLDRRYGWHRLPLPLGIATLLGLRQRLQRKNLHDTGTPRDVPAPQFHPRYLTARSLDGTYNDPSQPLMGSVEARFGRNVPLERTWPETPPRVLEPSPRLISRELMTRRAFIPATTLNLLAAAWIQFEVHDWVFHGIPPDDEPWEVPLADDDQWPERPMRINRSRTDPHPDANGGPPTWSSAETHWWDGSQVYGLNQEHAARLRTGEHGKLRIDERGLQPSELEEGLDYRGVPGSLWIGLAILHSLFVREHNAICDHLHSRYPGLGDDDLFDKARLVVAALMAKIHTVEWTPAIIAHPTTKFGMHAQWSGIAGPQLQQVGKRLRIAILGGIPGSNTSLHDVPYSLTEEFVAVYRMHPLLPDEFTFRSVSTDEVLQERTFPEVAVLEMRNRLEELEMGDVFYSFGVAHPGQITLHNYPRFLQEFHRADGAVLDLAAIDVLRMRERGVPRYNEFRRLLHRAPVRSFEELAAGDREQAEELRRIYDGDLASVDLMVGLFAERPPAGFGFSDTAFRIFILMATRRLESDRFFTVDYTPGVYTPAGLEWIDRNSMRTMLLRHFPQLEPALLGVSNPFAPWRKTG
jgi:hypothetical protein